MDRPDDERMALDHMIVTVRQSDQMRRKRSSQLQRSQTQFRSRYIYILHFFQTFADTLRQTSFSLRAAQTGRPRRSAVQCCKEVAS